MDNSEWNTTVGAPQLMAVVFAVGVLVSKRHTRANSELYKLKRAMTALQTEIGRALLEPIRLMLMDEYERLHYLHGTRNKVLFVTGMWVVLVSVYGGVW